MKTVKNEVEFVKKVFNAQRLKQIDEIADTQKKMGYDVALLKLDMENAAKKIELDGLHQKIEEYATITMVKEVSDDVNEKVTKQEFNVFVRETENLKKDIDRLCTREEVNARFSAVAVDVHHKIEQRPTINYFKRVLKSYDDKFEVQ